jgi:hypothetical protein
VILIPKSHKNNNTARKEHCRQISLMNIDPQENTRKPNYTLKGSFTMATKWYLSL